MIDRFRQLVFVGLALTDAAFAQQAPPELRLEALWDGVEHVQVVHKWSVVREGDLLMSWGEHLIAYGSGAWRVLDPQGDVVMAGVLPEGDPLVLAKDARVDAASSYGDDRLELVRGRAAFLGTLQKGDRPLAGPLVSGEQLMFATVQGDTVHTMQRPLVGEEPQEQRFSLSWAAGPGLKQPTLVHLAPVAGGLDLLFREGTAYEDGSAMRLVRIRGDERSVAELPKRSKVHAVSDVDGLSVTVRTEEGFSLVSPETTLAVQVPRDESFSYAGPLQAAGEGRFVVVTSRAAKTWIHGFRWRDGVLTHQGRADLQSVEPQVKSPSKSAGRGHRVLDVAVQGDRTALVLGTPVWVDEIGEDYYTFHRGTVVELAGFTDVTSLAYLPATRLPDMFQVQEGWNKFLDVRLTAEGVSLDLLHWADDVGHLRHHRLGQGAWGSTDVSGTQHPETNLLFTSRNGVFRDLAGAGTVLLKPTSVKAVPDSSAKRWTFGVGLRVGDEEESAQTDP